MPAVTVLPDIYQGEGKWVKFAYTNKETGAAIPLTGCEFTYHVKVDLDDEEVLFEGETWDETQLANGIVRVNMPASFTEELEVGTYFGQLEVVFTVDTDVDKSQFVKFKILKPIVSS